MKFGMFEIGATHLVVHNDSIALETITGASTRRPFLGSGVIFALGTSGFAAGFADILYPHELLMAAGIALAAIVVGLGIGQLTLISRDLRGSKLAETIYGTYHDLSRERPRIMDAAHRARQEARP